MSPFAASPDAAPRRRYQSPRRAQHAEETRAVVVAAATRLFTAHGWAGTGMRDIAREAGVATETVYAHFTSKKGVLQRAMDEAVVGDEAAVALGGRPEFAALGQGGRADRIAAAALLQTQVQQRTEGFAKVLREAAPTDGEIAGMLAATRERIRLDIAAGAELVIGRALSDEELDGLWAVLSVEVYLLLVEVSGWSVEQYQTWVAKAMERHLPNS